MFFENVQANSSAQHEVNQRTYFTHNFFQNIIYPEAGLVSDNEKEIRRSKRKFILGAIAMAVCGICVLATWQNYFYQNKTT